MPGEEEANERGDVERIKDLPVNTTCKERANISNVFATFIFRRRITLNEIREFSTADIANIHQIGDDDSL